jgi:hypothetical protein
MQFLPVSSRLVEMFRTEPTELWHSVTGATLGAGDPRTAARGETEEGRLQSYPHRVRTYPLRDFDG